MVIGPREYHQPRRLVLYTEAVGMSSPNNGSRTQEQTSFDTNMVIILAALLCALICALGLNSIVRCALRCSRRLAFGTPGQAAAIGLKKRALRQIPVAVYGSGTRIPTTECPICLAEFVDGEKVRVLPKCNHGFHMRCVDTWLVSNSSCPTCRHSVLERPNTSDAADVDTGTRQPGVESGGQAGVVIVVDDVS